MEKYDPLWSDINTLLSYLRSFDVVARVEAHYEQFANDAPASLLRSKIEMLQRRLDEAKMSTIDYDKRIDCAAILAPDGRIWTGKRHGHCIQTIIQATGVKHVGEGYVQGFVTMRRDKEFPQGRFVDREEAAMIAVHAGQAKLTLPCELFSEDLY